MGVGMHTYSCLHSTGQNVDTTLECTVESTTREQVFSCPLRYHHAPPAQTRPRQCCLYTSVFASPINFCADDEFLGVMSSESQKMWRRTPTGALRTVSLTNDPISVFTLISSNSGHARMVAPLGQAQQIFLQPFVKCVDTYSHQVHESPPPLPFSTGEMLRLERDA